MLVSTLFRYADYSAISRVLQQVGPNMIMLGYHINTMTTSHSPADDGRKDSSESSCYIYIYCYFYVFTQLFKSLEC